MGHIILPERIGLVVCPNEHRLDDRLLVTSMDGKETYTRYIIQVVIKAGREVRRYFYPPNIVAIALLEAHFRDFPSIPMMMTEKYCAVCLDFDFPHFYRKPFRFKPLQEED